MTPEEFRASRRQNVRLPNGMEFEIRRIGALDFLAMGGTADLRSFIGKPKADTLKAVTGHLQELFKNVLTDLMTERGFLEKIVIFGAVSPKVVREPDVPGTVHVGDFMQEELSVFAGGILKFSFLTKQEAQKLDPLPETADSLSTSTPSESDTESSQAKSSQSPGNGNSQPTPSTSPVPAQESPKKTQPEHAQSRKAEADSEEQHPEPEHP